MSYWPLCRTSPPFPQNPSRRFLREGGPGARANRGRTFRMHFFKLGTPLRRARLLEPRIHGCLAEVFRTTVAALRRNAPSSQSGNRIGNTRLLPSGQGQSLCPPPSRERTTHEPMDRTRQTEERHLGGTLPSAHRRQPVLGGHPGGVGGALPHRVRLRRGDALLPQSIPTSSRVSSARISTSPTTSRPVPPLPRHTAPPTW